MFLESTSEPIASALRVTNKWSSNLAARNIFLTLSLQLSEQADLETSRTLVKRWAENHGISTKGVFIDNGSGLSRNGRVTVAAVSKILNVAWLDPSMPEFISSFSVPGVDGTLKSKFHSSPVNAKAHLKTGYLEGVRSIAGYLHLPQGRTLSVVIIMNHESLTKSSKTMENLVESLFQTR
jgi:serine-type D-Ala-D-Ala carboxypeptidase/endopeptidase (penicillin-binding protein 4)